MLLWSKIICHLEITLPDHHPEDPYDVDQVFEGAKWVLKGMDTSMTKTSNGTSGIPSPIANAPAAPLPMPKRETLELTTTTAIVSTLECLEALLTNGNAQPCQQFANSTCHFCGEIGHTMVQGTCMKLEQMIQQGKVHWNAKGKIVLPSDPEQAAMQQSLIHKVMQQDVAMSQALSKEEWIEALERELFALSNTSATSSSSDLTPAPAAKPADKGQASECTVANEQLPVAKEPIAQPPIHPFSGIPGCYVPPANRNFTAPDRTNNGAYQTMPPIYNIEQSKAVFKQVLSTKVTVLVGKLCSVSQDIWNQFRTAVMPKRLVGASANTVQDPSSIFKGILPTFAIEEPQFLLGSNVDTANRLTLDKAPFASVDPVKAYINLLPHGEEPVVLTVAKDS
ncbi:hypothetical protein C0989_007741, partial [Termitomyces sp. Mn162]